ncbi:flagellar basal body P-ring formation chaperone FlgA [bacterium]|nr:flagellar basal body P-ring formation chaperone FlgA [bacterium]
MITKKTAIVAIILFSLFGVFPCGGSAEQNAGEKPRITVIGKQKITVTGKTIFLRDVARVRSKDVADDDAIIALKELSLGKSPRPGETVTLSANQILDILRGEGVQLDSLGYAFPRVVSVTRAGRKLSFSEVDAIIRNALPSDGDSELLEIFYDETVSVAPGIVTLTANIKPSQKVGRQLARIRAEVEGEEPVFFTVPLTVKEWVQVPVAKRALPRGSIVSSYDVVMARAELSKIPLDTAREPAQIVGQEMKYAIGYGEVFRKGKLAIPPIVERGGRVTLVYRTALLEATATGVALEDGIQGQRIRVRNESSKKTVTGEIVEPGLIRVNP